MLYPEHLVNGIAEHTFAYLEVEERDHILTITLNRPDKKNAMNPVLMAELAYAMSYAHFNTDVWQVIIGANGNVFCAGADLKAFAGLEQEPTASTIPKPPGEVLVGELFVKVHRPCIARVHGPVYAGGFMIVAGCHFVVSSPEATFALPEVKRGLFPMQVMANLLTILPPRQVLDLCLTGRTLSAEEAYNYGLVTKLVPPADLDIAVAELSHTLRANSPTAMRLGLRAFDELRASGNAHAFLKEQLNEALQTEDAREGLAAFREKRPPLWSGK